MDFSQVQKNRVNTLLIQMVECYRDERKLSYCVSLLDELSSRYSINDIVAQANPELLNFFSDRIWPFILLDPTRIYILSPQFEVKTQHGCLLKRVTKE